MPKLDTIVAQATPSGAGGVAVVRISGANVATIMQAMLGKILTPRLACYAQFLDHNNECIDAGIAVFFQAPHSFTGEDVLELQGHGGTVVVDMLIKRVLSLGARLANPGEFSLRAFLNNKIDLTQAEAIADLIHANSEAAARSAMRSLQGEFSKKISALNEKIVALRMHVEAAIDFASEDIDFIQDQAIFEQLQQLLQNISDIEAEAKQGSLLQEGATLVIAGQPNVGKSSLLNALSGQDLAIVTPIAGTTRDVRRERIILDGLPITLIDTAGLRFTEDVIEQEGIKRAKQAIANADAILQVNDATLAAETLEMIRPLNCPVLNIVNKIDLTDQPQPRVVENEAGVSIFLSVKTGAGLSLLIQHIKKVVGFNDSSNGVYYARRRHLSALAYAKQHVSSSLDQWQGTQFGELIAEDLRLAHLSLCDITGEFTTEDLLGKIFSNFCIGK